MRRNAVAPMMRCRDNDAIDRRFRRLKNDVVFTLCAVTVVQGLLTLLLIKII